MPAPKLDPNRILSIQSHVVSGYVGESQGDKQLRNLHLQELR